MVKITDDQLAKIHDQALKGMRFGSQMVVDLCEEVRDARLTTSQLAQTMPCAAIPQKDYATEETKVMRDLMVELAKAYKRLKQMDNERNRGEGDPEDEHIRAEYELEEATRRYAPKKRPLLDDMDQMRRYIEAINYLRQDEGSSVEIACDNPEGEPNATVRIAYMCPHDGRRWKVRRFTGSTVLEALELAAATRMKESGSE